MPIKAPASLGYLSVSVAGIVTEALLWTSLTSVWPVVWLFSSTTVSSIGETAFSIFVSASTGAVSATLSVISVLGTSSVATISVLSLELFVSTLTALYSSLAVWRFSTLVVPSSTEGILSFLDSLFCSYEGVKLSSTDWLLLKCSVASVPPPFVFWAVRLLSIVVFSTSLFVSIEATFACSAFRASLCSSVLTVFSTFSFKLSARLLVTFTLSSWATVVSALTVRPLTPIKVNPINTEAAPTVNLRIEKRGFCGLIFRIFSL